MDEEIYKQLAKHLSSLGMGYPEKKDLLDILRENFTPLESEVALAIPVDRIPFDLFQSKRSLLVQESQKRNWVGSYQI